MKRIFVAAVLSVLCVAAHAETLDLVCVGQDKWKDNWNHAFRIDMAKERLVDYVSIWEKVKAPREISVSLEIDDATIVIVDRFKKPSDKGWHLNKITLSRIDGSFEVWGIAGTTAWGRCTKREERAF